MTTMSRHVHGAIDRDRGPVRVVLLACALLLLAGAGHAQQNRAQLAAKETEAQFASDFAIDDRDPERNVPSEAERNAKPIDFGNYLMALAGKAEEAATRGDHLSEAKYYGALAKAVPERSIAFTKRCAAYEAAGKRDAAEQSCKEALGRAGVTVADFVHYVRVVLSQHGSLSKAQVAGVDAAIAHVQAQAPKLTVGAELACDLGARLNDGARLARCTSELRKRAPNDLKTISYEWAFALTRADRVAAERAIDRAKQLGMRSPEVARMKEVTRAATASSWRRALVEKPTVALLAAGAAGALLLLLSRAMRRRRALHQVSV